MSVLFQCSFSGSDFEEEAIFQITNNADIPALRVCADLYLTSRKRPAPETAEPAAKKKAPAKDSSDDSSDDEPPAKKPVVRIVCCVIFHSYDLGDGVFYDKWKIYIGPAIKLEYH